MLVDYHISALLADEALADEVWALWDAGEITDELAALAWWMTALGARNRIGAARLAWFARNT